MFLDDTQRHYMEESYPTNPSAPAPFSTLQASHSHLHLNSLRGNDEYSLDAMEDADGLSRDSAAGRAKVYGEGAHPTSSRSETLFALAEEGEATAGEDSQYLKPGTSLPGRSRSTTPRPRMPGQGSEDKSAQRSPQEERDSFDQWG